jgi:hypothetical protein
MCRYAYKIYKPHYACFACHKTFKQPFHYESVSQKTSRGGYSHASKIVVGNDQPVCPECRQPMHHMGHEFKAPKQSNKKQWEKVKQLFFAGFTHHSCGCGGSGAYPQQLREIPEFIRQHRRQTVGQKLLEQFSNRASANSR